MKRLLISVFLVLLLAVSCLAAEEYNGYIVRIKDNPLDAVAETMFSDRAFLFSDMEDGEVVELIADELDEVSVITSDHMLVKASDEVSLDELLDLGLVDYYEKNYYAELCGYDFSANAYYSNQKWYLDAINVDFAWNAGIYGGDTKVAVIDSGVFLNNDIKNNLVPGKNYLSGESSSETGDSVGHGTAVAGIIAAQCNSIGTVGIAPKAKIVPLKVTNARGVELSAIVEALYDAVDEYECDVINMSFGMSSDTTALKNAVDYALSRKIIVVAAAGNDGDNGYLYPASYDGVISVANAKRNNGSFIISGTSQKNDKVDVAAPGTDVYSLVNGTDGALPFNGTSFSAPMVSAVAALAKSVDSSIDSYEFERLIKLTADSSYISASGQGSNAWGSGMIDINAFLKAFVKDDYYVSKHLTTGDNTSVFITNFTAAPIENGTVVVSSYDENGQLSLVTNLPLSLDAYESYELSLTNHSLDMYSKVSYVGKRLPGDVNNDGVVSLMDASVIMRRLAGYTVNVPPSSLDVNGDGNVSLLDASALMRYLAGYTVVLH